MDELTRSRIALSELALKYRQADFPELEFEDKRFFNDIGKILGYMHYILMAYSYADEEKKLRIRRVVSQLVEAYMCLLKEIG